MATGQGEGVRADAPGELEELSADGAQDGVGGSPADEDAAAKDQGDDVAPGEDPPEEAAVAAAEQRLREAEARLEESERLLEAAKEEAAQLRDQYLRLRAEFDNFRKRTRAEVEAIKSRAAEDLVVALLPVIDNLERAVDSAKKTEGAPKALVDGVEMVLRQFLAELSAVGVSRIEALGTPFDPNLHEAVAYEESDEHPDGLVIEVLRTGYSLNEKVLRPSMVKVAKGRVQEGKRDE